MSVCERCMGFSDYSEKVFELFASRGFGQVDMRELATFLGSSVGSFYHHYSFSSLPICDRFHLRVLR